MKMKRSGCLTAVCALLLCAALLPALSGCTGYFHEQPPVTRDGIVFEISDFRTKAYARTYYWDLDPDNTDIYIPDTVDGIKVTGFGGYYGTGVRDLFTVLPDEICTDPYESASDHRDVMHEWRDVPMTVHLGKNIDTVPDRFVDSPYYSVRNPDSSYSFYRPVFRFECDPENPFFYSSDGVLYLRRNGSPVFTPEQVTRPSGTYYPPGWEDAASGSDIAKD